MGIKRPGDNLFSSSIVALHLDGTYAWHFQMVHHDLWDFDCPSPVVLFDQVYGGVMRKGIAEACKTGWIYILDRTNGKPLIGIDEKPVEQDRARRDRADAADPARRCADPAMSAAARRLDDEMHFRRDLRHADPDVAGRQWRHQLGAHGLQPADRIFLRHRGRPAAKPHLAAAGQNRSARRSARNIPARFRQWIPARNKIVWQKKMPYSIGQGSGALATASGLVFHGEPDGNFQAYDARSGDLLWQWQTGAGADAPAVTYEIDGEQYVAIAAGGVAIQTTSANSDMIWAFSLNGSARAGACSLSIRRVRRKPWWVSMARWKRQIPSNWSIMPLRPHASRWPRATQGDIHQ